MFFDYSFQSDICDVGILVFLWFQLLVVLFVGFLFELVYFKNMFDYNLYIYKVLGF